MTAPERVVGRRLPKMDAAAKAKGEVTYGHDVRLPGMLHGRILYAGIPCGRILRVDTSRAEALPGVRCVLTAADNPPHRFGYARDTTAFKGEAVCSPRDEVAAVAAVDDATAEEALALIDVEYEARPGVFTPDEALAPGAPLIHPERGTNLFKRFDYIHGDPIRGEAESDIVVEAGYRLPWVDHACMETSVVVAHFEADGRLTMWSTTQIPFLLQRDLAGALGIPGSKIRIIQTAIGGAFGRGLDMYPFEPIAALMARKAGKPVRLAFSRQEEFTAAPVRQPAEVIVRAGARADGTLTFREVHAALDVGAYVSWGALTSLVMMETAASLYQVPHVRFVADCVYTNNPVTGAVRGYGNPQSTFFVETMMDRLAHSLGMDPVEFRLKNANRPDTRTPQGLVITSCGLPECLKALASASREPVDSGGEEARVPTGWKIGTGYAATLNVGGGARIYRSDGCGATVKVDDFGHVTLITGSTEIGQGSETALAMIVAETLGVGLDQVSVVNSDTDVKPWDVGVHASRTTFIAGKAAHMAAAAAREQIFETAAGMLKAPAADLVARDGAVAVRGSDTRRVDVAKVVRHRHFQSGGQDVVGTGWCDPPTELVDKDTFKGNISDTYSFGAQMARVAVDPDTGLVRVLRLACAADVGRAINPMAVEGQLEGGIQMGLGYALTEELQVEEGRVMNPDLLDYRLFTSADMPALDTFIVETDDPSGPFGAKGVGEIGGTPTAAAIANAIFDAVGVRLDELPMTPERVLAALDRAAAAPPGNAGPATEGAQSPDGAAMLTHAATETNS